MATSKKSTFKQSASKSKFVEPYLEHLIFTKAYSNLAVNEDGMPVEFTLKGAGMRLTLTPGCHTVHEENDSRPRAAITLGLEAKAANNDDSPSFFEGEVRAVGYFLCDPSMTAEDIKREFSKKSPYFDNALNVVHAVAARELERLIELTGIPSPGLPLSQNPAVL